MSACKCLVGCAILAVAGTSAAQTFHPDIPRAWDDKAVERFEVPLAQRDRSPRYLTAKQYYALKVRPIDRTYPVYLAGRMPEGYMAPEGEGAGDRFDASRLQTKEDWIRAGEEVFNASPGVAPAPPGGFQMPPGATVPTTRIVPYDP